MGGSRKPSRGQPCLRFGDQALRATTHFVKPPAKIYVIAIADSIARHRDLAQALCHRVLIVEMRQGVLRMVPRPSSVVSRLL